MKNPAFSNSMELDNYPGQTDSEAESRGGDHREIQDNGTGGHNTYVMGAPSGNSFPKIPDPHGGSDDDNYQADYGLNEKVEVGFNGGGIHNYGLTGSAGGGKKQNMDD